MFGGEKTKVKLAFSGEYVGVILDRFGRDITIRPADKSGWFETSVDVALSDQFLGWIFALGTKVRIAGPEDVVEMFKNEISTIMQNMFW